MDKSVTGRPMSDYAPYVDMLSHVFANALALAADRDFLMSLDRSLPLHEAVRPAVTSSIQWRFAIDIDEIEAARQ